MTLNDCTPKKKNGDHNGWAVKDPKGLEISCFYLNYLPLLAFGSQFFTLLKLNIYNLSINKMVAIVSLYPMTNRNVTIRSGRMPGLVSK